jgi:5-carboxymethyl-2-hydroxymuconate isomerase
MWRLGNAGGSALCCRRSRPQHVFCARRAVNAGEFMPHIIAEYSANLEDCLDIQALVDDLHQAAIEVRVAELVAIRTRAARREYFRVADGNPANGFVHITARLRIGRPEELRTRLGEALLAAADKRLTEVYPSHPIGLTVEIHEIDDMTFRRNTLRERAQLSSLGAA